MGGWLPCVAPEWRAGGVPQSTRMPFQSGNGEMKTRPGGAEPVTYEHTAPRVVVGTGTARVRECVKEIGFCFPIYRLVYL